MVRSYIKLISGMLIFGSIGIFVSIIPMASEEIVFIRTLVGGIFLLLISFISKEEFKFKDYKKNAIPLLISGICLGINWAFLYEAYRYTSVSIATLIYYLAPVFVMIASPIILKEKLTKNRIVGIIVTMIGIFLVNGVSVSGLDPKKGFIFGILAALFYAGLTLTNKFIKDLPGLAITTVQLFVAALIMFIYMKMRGSEGIVLPEGKALVSLMVLCILHTAIGCYLFFTSVQELPAQSVALLSYIDPLAALIFSAVFLKEKLGLIQILGAVLILGGAAYGELRGRKKRLEKQTK